MRILFALLATLAYGQSHTTERMRIEYLDSPLTIDVPTPRFSYALSHPSRAQYQTNYHLVLSSLNPLTTVWDSGVVTSNNTLNIPYAGPALASDTDYQWTVVWADNAGALSTPATSYFSTALYDPTWQGATWVSSQTNGSLNTYRTTFTLASVPTRARLYIHGLGYAKSWVNGALTDDHELGTFTTFQKRTLYDVWDITQTLKAGCNTLGVMLGHGWFAQEHVHAGDRQFRVLLSVTMPGSTTPVYYTSTPGASGSGNQLTFVATQGPVLADDIYVGETYSGLIAAALDGWSTCAFTPTPGTWVPSQAPDVSPATFGSIISAHNVHIETDRTYSVATITQPLPGVYVFGT